MRIGLVLAHYGNTNVTKRFLQSLSLAVAGLVDYDPSIVFKIVIVDNSKNLIIQNDTMPRMANLEILVPRENLGYSGACSCGTESLRDCDFLFFSNNDIILFENTLTNLVKSLDVLPDLGALQPLGLRADDGEIGPTAEIDSMGITCNPLMNVFSYSNWPIEPIGTLRIDGRVFHEVFGIDGMFFGMRSKTWFELGGWDPSLFMFNEDLMISWKIRLAGLKNYVVLDSVVGHVRGSSAQGSFIKENPIYPAFYISRNKLLTMLYIYDRKWLLKYFVVGLIFEFGKNSLLSLRSRSIAHIMYYLRGLVDIGRKQRLIIEERKKVVHNVSLNTLIDDQQILSLRLSLRLIARNMRTILGEDKG